MVVRWWDRIKRWWRRFLAKYGGGSGGGGVEPGLLSYPEKPADVIGYGLVNMRDIPADQLARELATAGLNTCQLEFAWWKSAEAWDNPQAAIDRAVRVVTAMRQRKILSRINLWNANVGLGKYGDPVRLRLDQRPLSYYTDIVDRLIAALGTTEGVDLQGVSEWNSERARQIDEYVARRWSGSRSYNRGARLATGAASGTRAARATRGQRIRDAWWSAITVTGYAKCRGAMCTDWRIPTC